MQEPHEVVHPEFEVHMLNDNGKRAAREIAESFSRLLTGLTDYCPAGRELSIVKTKLEEASFFAKKSMAKQRSNQQ